MIKTPPTTLIRTAVSPLREAAMDMAAAQANLVVAKVTETLAAAGNDLQKCAPHPRSFGMGRAEYKRQHSKYSLYRILTDRRDVSHGRNVSELADISPEKVARFVEDARKAAAAQYESYVGKLEHKIGTVTEAALTSGNQETGRNIWCFSELRVTAAGQVQVWRTRLVYNFSVLGTPYIQFPTRQVKS